MTLTIEWLAAVPADEGLVMRDTWLLLSAIIAYPEPGPPT
jgi:hypothetical protein